MTDKENSVLTVQNEHGSKPFKKARKTGRAKEVLDGLTDVYRHYDANGALLYVGISLSAFTRLKGHRRYSGWFKQIAHITVEHCETRLKAEIAEAWAIRYEKPLYNKTIPWVPDHDPFDAEEEALRLKTNSALLCKMIRESRERAKKDRRGKIKQEAVDAGVETAFCP